MRRKRWRERKFCREITEMNEKDKEEKIKHGEEGILKKEKMEIKKIEEGKI